ncbi:MAG: hypothetical protein ACYTEQ_15680 [Planctomycetota bacterium]
MKETGVTAENAEDALRSEVETYDQFLRGDVWGYIVEDGEGEHIDSCWGFFGEEAAQAEGDASLAAHQPAT